MGDNIDDWTLDPNAGNGHSSNSHVLPNTISEIDNALHVVGFLFGLLSPALCRHQFVIIRFISNANGSHIAKKAFI